MWWIPPLFGREVTEGCRLRSGMASVMNTVMHFLHCEYCYALGGVRLQIFIALALYKDHSAVDPTDAPAVVLACKSDYHRLSYAWANHR